MNISITKICSKCKQEKPASEFSKDRRRKEGLHSHCRSCRSIYNASYRADHCQEIAVRMAAYHAEHRDKKAAYDAAYYAKHREEIVARVSAYHAEHREEKATYNAAYYAKHREEKAAYHAEHREEIAVRKAAWQKSNPEKCRANQRRRRARKRAAGGDHTSADVQRQGDSQEWKCWWRGPHCLIDCRDKYHVDHLVPLARGGHNGPSNIVISCPNCNLSKKDKLPHEWIGKLL